MSCQYKIFSGSSHIELAKNVAKNLNVPLGKIDIKSFPDNEICVQVLENVRNRDVFVVQTIANRPNHFFMELLIIVDALKRASAKSITAIIPYFGYARQDRKDKVRVPITAKLIADLLEKAGVTHLMTMDLHADQIQGFFNIPVDNLTARVVFIEKLRDKGLSKDFVIVAPDIGSSKLANRFAKDLQVDLAVIDKRRITPEKVEDIALIGEVEGKDVVIVDDICSTGETLRQASKLCKKGGARKVFALVTHGPFADFNLSDCAIDKLYFTDTIPPKEGIEYVSVAPIFAKAIDLSYTSQSLSSLFCEKEQ